MNVAGVSRQVNVFNIIIKLKNIMQIYHVGYLNMEKINRNLMAGNR